MNQTDLKTLDPQQLIEFLGDSDGSFREAASSALSEKGKMSLPALIEGMSHHDWQVRAACAGLLDHLADDRCIDPLRRALRDPSPHVRRHAVHSLGCNQCKAVPLGVDIIALLLETALHDTSIRVRRVAVHQLGLQAYDPRATETLEKILRQDTDSKILSRAEFALYSQQRQQINGA